ncbi:MAG: XRE family transcriptional regulator [Bacteroidetes bacterium]|nr:XRE family transcriptional regulator [Bacteroidota bacterium]
MKIQEFAFQAEQLKEIGIILRTLRLKKGYSSAETFSYDFDLNRTNYWRWENGQNMTVKNIYRICEIHEISPKDFFELVEKRVQRKEKS